jgi:selenide, water dikinase
VNQKEPKHDMTKRARVMARSKKLGHCICDPRKPCPCTLYISDNICLCAGERLEKPGDASEQPQLTKRVKSAGCASKIPAADLARVLGQLPPADDPRLLVGLGTADDAGVFKISDDLALVQTVDVFAPSVDDPYLFGQIAVCNSLSDVYAMGGTPVSALSVISFPIHTLNEEWMVQMLRGSMDKLKEAGVALAGGHSINGEEILFGFAVTGTIHPKRIVSNAGAQVGDMLILTKPIGTGIISFAAQVGKADEEEIAAIGKSMSTLNRFAAEVMVRHEAHACTDVTGFGVLGHLTHMVRESGIGAELWWDAVPTFPGVEECAKDGICSGAVERNREFAEANVSVCEGVPPHALDILYDAQTSGGLLIAIPANKTDALLAELREGCADAAIIGRIVQGPIGKIAVSSSSQSPIAAPTPKEENAMSASCCSGSSDNSAKNACCTPAASECCSGGDSASAGAPEAAFLAFTGKTLAPGALDVAQKEIMTIALSVAVQCEDCLRIHLEKARKMGVSDAEIEEAAWMGVMFGGCKSMMLWKDVANCGS